MPGMLELHLTTSPIAASQLDSFAQRCHAVGGKALIVELSRGVHAVQPMATFHLQGNLAKVQAVADELCDAFNSAGYAMVRRKIEFNLHGSALHRPAAQYVEWHGRVSIAQTELDDLQDLCGRWGAHLSRNSLRGGDRRFVTVRANTVTGLEAQVAGLRAHLIAAGWVPDRDCWEGVAFDSNLQLDQGWL